MDLEARRRRVQFVQRYFANPPVRALLRLGLGGRTHALIETVGRTSGRPRHTPVGIAREPGTVWVVAEHGRHAGYVKNIEADPRVRVKIGRRWHQGTAHLLPDDDPVARQERMFPKGNARIVRRLGTDLMTIRIDLDERDGSRP